MIDAIESNKYIISANLDMLHYLSDLWGQEPGQQFSLLKQTIQFRNWAGIEWNIRLTDTG